MLNHLPKKITQKTSKDIFFSNKPVVYNKLTIDRRTCNSTTPADIADDTLDNRITLFQNQLKDEFA